jgi:integrase
LPPASAHFCSVQSDFADVARLGQILFPHRHTVSAWGKEAGLQLEDVKTLLRHENIATTSDIYGDLGLEAKRRISKG